MKDSVARFCFRLTASCAALRALVLKRLTIGSARRIDTADIVAPHASLSSLTLSSVIPAPAGGSDAFIPTRATRLEALTLSHERLFGSSRRTAARLERLVVHNKDRLTRLALLDPANHDAHRLVTPPAQLGSALAQLAHLRTLEISPAATGNLAQILAPLTKLEDLAIVQGLAMSSSPPTGADVVAIVNGPAPLRRVAVSAVLVEAWSAQDQQAVADAAGRKGVAFVRL